jgi:hypothetical protein
MQSGAKLVFGLEGQVTMDTVAELAEKDGTDAFAVRIA